ncbi:hypothetical protein [Tautonia plasticadhaerens]|uniref:Glycoside hydrolase family 42 N-terminal domain-containing protein n=1 Tax=Tautonia plasticadhaerens TaxID=2527974 RepID=A0A518GYU4_9BACT|nr:hypothetical protein [Tautonia plasticadhaerens]QDV33737.1 hypothetical protein ElP_16160 [Tautonia plasticadhaerens]
MLPILTALTALTVMWLPAADDPKAAGPFAQRGYYITFMRMPTYDLDAWETIIDGIQGDGGNTLLLWVAGAFRSEKYPITWRYNADHENVREDFVRDLIDHAHSKGIRVLLGFTPFGYDGVNQYPLEHPELRAIGQDGMPVEPFGIGCWGYNLCPSRPESQRFMLEYAREMLDAYPDADGLLIESSDYAICHCRDCGDRFFEEEFRFVRGISEEVWARKAEATVVVFPHYFSGADVPGFGVKAAKLPFDPRWSLVFTPHSARPEPDLIERARSSLWWDDSPARRGPQEIRAGARHAREIGATGYVPSLEAFTFVAAEAEEGQAWLKGKRQVPLGFGWLDPGEPPYDELPMRVQRIAYREFVRNPDLSFERYKEILGLDLFGAASTTQAVEDVLELQAAFNFQRTWCQPSPLTSLERVRAMEDRGELTAEKRAEYRAALDRLRAIEGRHREPRSEGERELHRVAEWVVGRWAGEERLLLERSP